MYVDVAASLVASDLERLFGVAAFPESSGEEALLASAFGNSSFHDVCSYGFEPDTRHTHRLKAVEKVLREHGFDATVFPESAAGMRDSIGAQPAVVDLVAWLANQTMNATALVLKIGGDEEELLVHLLASAQLCRFRLVYAASGATETPFVSHLKKQLAGAGCPTQLVFLPVAGTAAPPPPVTALQPPAGEAAWEPHAVNTSCPLYLDCQTGNVGLGNQLENTVFCLDVAMRLRGTCASALHCIEAC